MMRDSDLMNDERMPTPFDPLTCPLAGSNLLEASAGTGKTFSLTFLYLRLILEKGLRVEEILVATFTNAATAELSERMYAQLTLAEALLTRMAAGDLADELAEQFENSEVLIALLSHLLADEHQELSVLQKRLRLAQAQFDYANILSIDAFALQQLRDHADIVGSYQPEEVLNNDKELIKKVYLKLAREDFKALGASAETVGKTVAGLSSEQLFSLLTQMVSHEKALAAAENEVLTNIAQHQQLLQQVITGDYAGMVEQVQLALDADVLNKQSYKPEKLQQFAACLGDEQAYCQGKAALPLLKFFSRSQLEGKLKKGKTFSFSHPLFDVFDALVHLSDSLVGEDAVVFYRSLRELATVIKNQLSVVKAEQMALTFADITQIVSERAGDIPTGLKAALIDEAQDTNTAQLTLFQRLFMRENAPETVCFFVGDPKQAIYGFRGANVYSYLNIQNMVEHRYLLPTNYRSSQAVNDSVNAFFAGDAPFMDERIVYTPVLSKKTNEKSDFSDQALTIITPEANKVDDLAMSAAQHLDQLLQSNKHIEGKPLRSADIAVLVRSHSQAERVKSALAQLGWSASFVGKASVYESDEAKLLYALLQAMIDEDIRSIRTLMITPLMGKTIESLNDETLVNQLRGELQGLSHVYEQRGFAVMFYRLLNQFGIAGRLLQASDGKRRLTNFIQLFELLQAVLQKQSLSLFGLCDWLAGRIHEADAESELRLEDDNAITIMTIHSSKGLEFPVVCLPFFDYLKNNTSNSAHVLVSHQQQKAVLSSLKDSEFEALVHDEELAENRRLAYVALTRAKYHNIIVKQPEPEKNKKNQTKANSMLSALLASLPAPEAVFDAPFTQQVAIELTHATQAAVSELPIYQAKAALKQYTSAWYLDSFSRLLMQAEHPEHQEKTVSENIALETALMRFPAGPRAGTALHEMYEHYMAHRQLDNDFSRVITDIYRKYLPDYALSHLPEPDEIASEIAATAAMPLASLAFALTDVAITEQSIEMKFFMHLPPSARQHLYADFGQTVGLDSEGFVHGYIDYCFAYQGKYYVLDYKSNKLGTHFEDYHRDNMHAEMQFHRYDQQALIYTLALCKHLMIRDEASYRQKIGGYIYLFIRGMNPAEPSDHGIYVDAVPWETLVPFMGLETGELA